MLQLNMKQILTAARDHFDRGALQIQTKTTNDPNTYSGPCAIGAALSAEDRRKFDQQEGYVTIWALANSNFVKFPNEAEEEDASTLQTTHDDGNVEKFEKILKEMEAKYDL